MFIGAVLSFENADSLHYLPNIWHYSSSKLWSFSMCLRRLVSWRISNRHPTYSWWWKTAPDHRLYVLMIGWCYLLRLWFLLCHNGYRSSISPSTCSNCYSTSTTASPSSANRYTSAKASRRPWWCRRWSYERLPIEWRRLQVEILHGLCQ